jgi:hypothetical protein
VTRASTSDAVEFGYAPPREVAPDLWEVRGEWRNVLGRRMTVIRLADGRVLVHNAIRLAEKDLEWLRALGDVAFVVAPNRFHSTDAPWMAHRFPAARLFVPRSRLAAFQRDGFAPEDVNADFPALDDMRCIPMRGTKLEEAAFLHRPTRTLVLCDLAFHMPDVFRGIARVLMRWNLVGGRFGPSRLTRLAFTRDRAALLASYAELLALDFDRVVVNHGDVLESEGRERLRAGVRAVFGADAVP